MENFAAARKVYVDHNSHPQGAEILIRNVSLEESAAWDQFVLDHPAGSLFHMTGFRRMIETVYGFETHYLGAFVDGKIVGVLPLVHHSPPFLASSLMSLPFAQYGGALAHDPLVLAQIKKRVIALAHELRVAHVEIRNQILGQSLDFQKVHGFATLKFEVQNSDEENLAAISSKKMRTHVRRVLSTPFECRDVTDPTRFFDLYRYGLHRKIGAPHPSLNHFITLFSNFSSQCVIREFYLGKELKAAGMCFIFKNILIPYYLAYDAEESVYTNRYMYFDIIRWASQHGIRTVDFGRSMVDTGAHRFKTQFGMQGTDLPYEVYLASGKDLPNRTSNNPFLSFASSVWKLLPEFITYPLGPKLIRIIPP